MKAPKAKFGEAYFKHGPHGSSGWGGNVQTASRGRVWEEPCPVCVRLLPRRQFAFSWSRKGRHSLLMVNPRTFEALQVKRDVPDEPDEYVKVAGDDR